MSLPLLQRLVRGYTLVSFSLAHKYQTKEGVNGSGKHSSLVKSFTIQPPGAFQVFHSRVGPWPYPQTLDLAGKAC
jgi:hypothetical protein